ncbi:hypothetical protein [[Mycobacterium] wendilense]|uniref:Twin-arginine translocation pathway signal n=1 Tax=[Mycobacterium] wendilense TaxID=3064284 RepID=A0ABN9NWN6_9MYCO|nr:hypothetical protein [Mycolicibacterium sp. MU0050]CAJ1581353.1 hypothetical protein MU0050_001520 [Mycolicibacterium sp. MU0050]
MTADEKSPAEQPEDPDTSTEPDSSPEAEAADAAEAEADDTAAAATEPADSEATEAADSAEEPTGNGAEKTVPKAKGARLLVIALAVLLVASAALTAWLYFTKYRPAQLTGATAQSEVLDAAKTGTLAALTYSPEDLDGDLATAKSHMTGDFLSYYTTFTDDVVRKAVDEKKVATTAEVVRAAVSEMNPDTAKVLLFVNQTTTSADRPDPSMAASSVLVTMTKVDGNWLISAFDPV